MIKRALIIFYVLSVLLIAGFARANQNTLPINKVSFDPEVSEVMVGIEGELINPCLGQPKVKLAQVAKASDVLELTVEAPSTSQFCAQVIDGRYNMLVDLRALTQQLDELSLPVDGQYKLVVPDAGFEMDVDFSRLVDISDFQFASLTGKLVQVDDNFFLMTPTGETILVHCPSTDEIGFALPLADYVGKEVILSGHFIDQRLPILELNDRFERSPGLIVATAISSTSF